MIHKTVSHLVLGFIAFALISCGETAVEVEGTSEQLKQISLEVEAFLNDSSLNREIEWQNAPVCGPADELYGWTVIGAIDTLQEDEIQKLVSQAEIDGFDHSVETVQNYDPETKTRSPLMKHSVDTDDWSLDFNRFFLKVQIKEETAELNSWAGEQENYCG